MRRFFLSLLVTCLLGCATTKAPLELAWNAAAEECNAPEEDACVTLLCRENACGVYHCEDVQAGVVLTRGARPPVRAPGAPGAGPRRNRRGAMGLSNGAEPIMVFPWRGTPSPTAPPSRQLPKGQWEKHHIFPQASDLAGWFKIRGIDIHQYVIPIPRDLHRRIHDGDGRGGQWNDAWREFRRGNPNPSPEELFKHAGELIYHFQLLGGPVQPYHSNPGT